MRKLIRYGGMLCMFVIFGVLPVQAQENSPGFSVDKICYRETVKIEKCFIINGWEICVTEERTEEDCFG